MHITGTHVNYYLVCHRKLWLFANSIQMEQNSELVSEGKLIHETSYGNRSEKFKELELDGIKIDFYDAKNKIVHEIKKSDKYESSHIWQLKYYLFVLMGNGIEGAIGMLEYPALRKRKEITLEEADKEVFKKYLIDIEKIIKQEHCPEKISRPKCRNCSYFDFCWIGEG